MDNQSGLCYKKGMKTTNMRNAVVLLWLGFAIALSTMYCGKKNPGPVLPAYLQKDFPSISKTVVNPKQSDPMKLAFFFWSSDCDNCAEAWNLVQKSLTTMQVLGVNTDSEANVAKAVAAAKKHGYPADSIADPKLELVQQLKAVGAPVLLISAGGDIEVSFRQISDFSPATFSTQINTKTGVQK